MPGEAFNRRDAKSAESAAGGELQIGQFWIAPMGGGKVFIANGRGEQMQIDEWRLEQEIEEFFWREF